MSLTKTSFAMITGAVANVLDYGADPTGADPSDSAFTQAFATGAKHVYVPQGTYKTTAVINRPAGVRLFGDGATFSVIQAAHNGIIVDTSPATLSGDGFNSFQDIGFTNAATFNSSIGIRISNMTACSLRRVYVTNGPAIGIQCVFVLNSEFDQLNVTDCSDVGIYLYSTGLATGVNRNVFNCINNTYNHEGIVIDVSGGLSNVFNDVAVEASTSFPVRISNCEQVTFNGLYLEGNAQSIDIRGGNTITFRDCFNVSAIPFIKVAGFAGTGVTVERLKDLSAGGVGGDNSILQITSDNKIVFPRVTPSGTGVTTSSTTLANYQEGVWVPTDQSGAGLTLTTGVCRWTKVGRIVTANYDLTYPATANGASSVIGGLPFLNKGYAAVNVGYTTVSALVRGLTSDDQRYFLWYKADGSRLLNSDLSGANIKGTIVFETNE
jgi:hypothetical protein